MIDPEGSKTRMVETIQVSKGGRVVIPAAMRKALHLEDGTRLVATLDPGSRTLFLVPVAEALDAVQAAAALLLQGVPSLSAELIADRRAEADS